MCHGNLTLAVGQWCHEQSRVLSRRFLCPSDSRSRKLLPPGRPGQMICSPVMVPPCVALGQLVPHVLSFCPQQSQETLLHMEVSENTHELTRCFLAFGAVSVLTVTQNQQLRFEALATSVADRHALWQHTPVTTREAGRTPAAAR